MSDYQTITAPADIKHDELCYMDRVFVGYCFHDKETGKRIDPSEVDARFQVAE